MYEEQDNEMHGENYTHGKLNDVKEGSVIEGDVTDGEASDGDEGNWTEEEEDTDGEASDGEEEYCPEKETDTDSEESYDEEDIVMEDEGKYKKENEAVANTGKKRIRKENVKENKKNKKEGKRTKKPCPIPHCDAKVVHLPKHLRNVHKWTTESSRVALTRFKLRKKYEFVSQETASAGNRRRKKKDEQGKNPKKANRKKKLCPFSGCMVVTERLPQHLQRKHKLKRQRRQYKAEAVLPEDTEDVACRVERMFSNPKEDIAERSSLSADFISVTQSTLRSKDKVFSGTQAKGLVEMFQDMVSAGKPISKPVVIERLAKNGLSGEYNVEQVVNRLKYERKQHRAKK